MGHARVTAIFWGFGLLNNLLSVVILSAAVDLVGQHAPKSVVLLADVLPSFLLKVTAPFFIHKITYNTRILSLILLSFCGMQCIANFDSVLVRIGGISLASASGGLGELTFLQLSHYYGPDSIHGWSSGTGGAGLAGSFVFMMMTTWFGISTARTLIMFSVMPFTIAVLYFWALPRQQLVDSNLAVGPSLHRDTYRKLRSLVMPYILPLTTVYVCEYIINQGISPTLLFPLEDMPFRSFRDVYVAYSTLYQVGVFVSRSSAPFFRLRQLHIASFLQGLNLLWAITQSLCMVLPNIWLVMAVIVYEGLLGGLAYVNTFMLVSESVAKEDREFAMGAVSISDSMGIVFAGLISLWLEKALCRYQIRDGRPWCELP